MTQPSDTPEPVAQANRVRTHDEINGEPKAALTLEQIKAEVRQRHNAAEMLLAELRSERKALDAKIRAAVADEQEARRLARALEPRSRKAPK